MTSVSRRRSPSVLTALGVLVALWLGLAAPGVSPVAGPPVVAAAVAQTAAAADPAAPAPPDLRTRAGR